MKENLEIEVLKLWEQKSYDEASELILRASLMTIKELAPKIELKFLSGQALAYVLNTIPIKDWGLNRTLTFNANNTLIIMPILQKKYQEEFDGANIENKIKIFEEVRDNYNTLWDGAENFLNQNWQHLVHLISNLEIGLKVHKALFTPCSNQLWSAIAALKTITVAAKNKTVAETVDLYPLLAESFKSELSDPIRVRLAEIILQKMEK